MVLELSGKDIKRQNIAWFLLCNNKTIELCGNIAYNVQCTNISLCEVEKNVTLCKRNRNPNGGLLHDSLI